jgi:chaperonin GroEL
MAAKLATVDEQLLAYPEGSGAISSVGISSSGTHEKTQAGEMQFDCGYLSPFFITDPERMEVDFENVHVLVYPGKISSKKDLLPLLEQLTKKSEPLLIIAEDFESEALAALVVKKLSGFLQIAAVSAPGFGDQRKRWMQDVARLTGSKGIEGPITQLRNIQMSDLGQARRVTINKNRTAIESEVAYHPLYIPEPPKSSASLI